MSHSWMPLYVGDYLRDTAHLSAAEHGAYLLLIMHYWQRGALPKNHSQLARICRLDDPSFATALPQLCEFFDSEWKHARIDQELQLAEERYLRRANAGKKGGNAKAMLHPRQSNAVAKRYQSQSQSHNKKEYKAEFEEWYSLYPKKEAREAAWKAFPQARQLASFDDIMGGTRRYIAKNIERQFIKQPASWLRSGCWSDEEAPKVKVNGHEVPTGLFIQHGTAEWKAWSDHVFQTTGRGPPTTDKRVNDRFVTGWYFPTLEPPTEKQGAA